MPVLTFVGHLSLVYPDVFTTSVTVLREHSLETHTAVRSPLLHDVALAPKLSVALETAEVLHVPASTFCLSALVRKNYLIAGPTARLYQLGVVPPTVQKLVLKKSKSGPPEVHHMSYR